MRGRREATPSPGYRCLIWLRSVTFSYRPTSPYASIRGGFGGSGGSAPVCSLMAARISCTAEDQLLFEQWFVCRHAVCMPYGHLALGLPTFNARQMWLSVSDWAKTKRGLILRVRNWGSLHHTCWGRQYRAGLCRRPRWWVHRSHMTWCTPNTPHCQCCRLIRHRPHYFKSGTFGEQLRYNHFGADLGYAFPSFFLLFFFQYNDVESWSHVHAAACSGKVNGNKTKGFRRPGKWLRRQ